MARSDHCSCGLPRERNRCCYDSDGNVCGTRVTPKFAGKSTGFSHAKCYMNFDQNCSTKITREHIVSESILQQFPDHFGVGGLNLKGLPSDFKFRAKDFSSNILCDRHNSATSDVDRAIGIFARRLFEVTNFLTDNGPISSELFVVNGYMVELWAAKTLMNLIYGGMASAHGQALQEPTGFTPQKLRQALLENALTHPDGLWVSIEGILPADTVGTTFAPILSVFSESLIQKELCDFSGL